MLVAVGNVTKKGKVKPSRNTLVSLQPHNADNGRMPAAALLPVDSTQVPQTPLGG